MRSLVLLLSLIHMPRGAPLKSFLLVRSIKLRKNSYRYTWIHNIYKVFNSRDSMYQDDNSWYGSYAHCQSIRAYRTSFFSHEPSIWRKKTQEGAPSQCLWYRKWHLVLAKLKGWGWQGFSSKNMSFKDALNPAYSSSTYKDLLGLLFFVD